MKALILAAGLGTRLAPITDNVPKSLVEVNGEPILFRQIRSLRLAGVRDITVVAGYLAGIMKDRVEEEFDGVRIVENRVFAKTNNMYSALIGLENIDVTDGLLMMNADVFLDQSVIQALLECPAPDAVVVDVGQYYEESMKVTAAQNGRLTHISKTIPESEALGCSIDVYKFSLSGSIAFEDACRRHIVDGGELNLWSEVALDESFDKVRFEACRLVGRWYEIDSYEDLAAAEELFSEK